MSTQMSTGETVPQIPATTGTEVIACSLSLDSFKVPPCLVW